MRLAQTLLPVLVLAPAAGAQSLDEEGRPDYSFLQWAEDWSRFDEDAPNDDVFDPMKHIVLGDDGAPWIRFGGRAEARFEAWRDFGFGAPAGQPAYDDEFVLSRLLAHADLHLNESFRVFVEGKSAQSTSRDLPGGRRTSDMDTLALQEAFFDWIVPLGDSTLRLRPGRQMLLFGNQRLISPLPWGNTLRTWQGVTAEWRQGPWSVHGLATLFVPVDKTNFNEADEDTKLYGLYAKRAPSSGGHGVELYALGNERADVTVNGTNGDERRWTLGSRLWGPLASTFDYELEGGWQFGEVGDGDVNAWFLASQAGWRPGGLAGDPRLFVGLDLASGDRNPGGNVQTFHQLFPLGHAYLGFVDAVGRQNVFAASAGSKWRLDSRSSFLLALHLFRVLETEDALYAANGTASRSGFSSREVGSEIDLLVDRSIGDHTRVYLGYSHFFAGAAIEQTGPAEDIDFAYLGASYTF